MDFGQVTGALFVAFVTGLAYLAAAFPKTFSSVSFALTVVGAVAIFGLIGYDISLGVGAHAALDFVDATKAAQARAAVEAIRPPTWSTWVLAGLNVYLITLGQISRRLTAEKEEKEGRGAKTK